VPPSTRVVLASLVVSLGVIVAGCARTPGDAPRPVADPVAVDRPPTAPPRRGPQPGVDCVAIAAALTSLELGNYAEPEDRAPREAELAAACGASPLTADDAKCLLEATKDTLPFCAHPLAVAHRDPPPKPPTPTIEAAAGNLPASCRDYIATIEKLSTCPKLPAASRDAMVQAMNQAAASWSQMTQQPEAVAALGNACQQGADALRQSLASLGCQ
jgi:hypothetical protein